MNMGRTFTPEEAEAYLAFILRYNRENPDTGKYLMFANDAFIGVGALYCRPEGAEIECVLLPEFWNRGHATEIVSELLKAARGKPEIHQIRAMMDPKKCRVPARTDQKQLRLRNNRAHRRGQYRRGNLFDSALTKGHSPELANAPVLCVAQKPHVNVQYTIHRIVMHLPFAAGKDQLDGRILRSRIVRMNGRYPPFAAVERLGCPE